MSPAVGAPALSTPGPHACCRTPAPGAALSLPVCLSSHLRPPVWDATELHLLVFDFAYDTSVMNFVNPVVRPEESVFSFVVAVCSPPTPETAQLVNAPVCRVWKLLEAGGSSVRIALAGVRPRPISSALGHTGARSRARSAPGSGAPVPPLPECGPAYPVGSLLPPRPPPTCPHRTRRRPRTSRRRR